MLSGHWISAPEVRRDPPPLLARLEPAPEPQVVPPPPPLARAAKPAPKASAPRVAAVPSLSPFSLPGEPSPEPPAIAPDAAPEVASVPEPVVVADAAPSTLVIEPAALKTLPRRGHIVYALMLG